ncbi:hypothetical protein ACI7YT_09040 [Microbacterium sp. M]
MTGESLMIGYILLSCGIAGTVLASVQAVRAKVRAGHDNRTSR